MRRRCCFPRTRLKQAELWAAVHQLILRNHEERLQEFEELMAQWRKRFPERPGGRRLVMNIYTGEIVKEEE